MVDEGVFAHSVASGDPLADRVVLWTRVTTDEPGPVETTWTVARDRELTDVVTSGTAVADPERDFTVQVDADGLSPETTYYYAFEALGERSPVGRTRTLPGKGAKHVRFAMVSCASYNAGFFNGYARMVERDDLAFVLHLGDYVYETPNVLPPGAPQPPEMGRPFDPPYECVKLADYRTRYAQYRRDPDVRALHEAYPMIATVDDHEYADGAWREGSSWHRPDEMGPYLDRKAAALKARWEWMPCRPPDDADPEHISRTVPIGDLADLFMMDVRTHRDIPTPPPEGLDPKRTTLGKAQREWLLHDLEASTARWRILGNPSVMGQTWCEHLPEAVRAPLATLKLLGDEGVGPNPDQWDGFPVERAAVLGQIRERGYDNVVVLSGDIHVGIALELHVDSFDGGDPVAVEFVTASLTSMNLDDKMGWPRRTPEALEIERATVETLDHWKWCEFDSNGYVLVDLTPERLQAEWWFGDTVLEPSTYEECAARFMVKHGAPRAVLVSEEPA
jgi:alkaline phosphatase D